MSKLEGEKGWWMIAALMCLGILSILYEHVWPVIVWFLTEGATK